MFKIVLNDLLINLKKSWITIILNLILFIFLSNYTITLTYSLTNDPNLRNEGISNFIRNESIIKQLLPIINGFAAYILLGIFNKIPLRVSKAIFVCAAGERDKINFLLLQLLIKIVFSFIFIFSLSFLIVGKFFSNNSYLLNIIQILLWLFIILDINLKIGIGEEGAREKDSEGYLIYSKEEIVVNYYWPCLLILEFVLFYTLYAFDIKLNFYTVLIWIIVFVINSYITLKCTLPILKKSISFENIYRQIPDKKEAH